MLKKVNNKGFSIIEVLIVLAIAGLIMLVVFLAVPALRLNAANSARQNDASRISSAVTDCLSNRNGLTASCDTFKDPDIATDTQAGEVEIGQMSQLQIGDGVAPLNATFPPQWTVFTTAAADTQATIDGRVALIANTPAGSNPDAIRWQVHYNAKCSADGSGVVFSNNRRDFAVVYGKGVRTGNPIPVCIGS